MGYFFPRREWLGIETEAYTTTPHLKSQVVQVTGPLGTQNIMIQGKHLRVTTLAFNLIARYPAKRVRPYAGAGLGIFFLGVPGIEKDLDTAPGLNVFAGLRFLPGAPPCRWDFVSFPLSLTLRDSHLAPG
jgi:hypothetical protein